jgi:putative SOS response-associated peptidase YedK
MKPCPDEWLSKAEVSQLVNSPKNNTPEVLEPAVMVRPTNVTQRRLFVV